MPTSRPYAPSRLRCSSAPAGSAPTAPGSAIENTQALARFGHAFRMGFQVLDDVLDLIGDEQRLGKPTGNDIASGVYTLPVLAALQGPGGDRLRGTHAPGGSGQRRWMWPG